MTNPISYYLKELFLFSYHTIQNKKTNKRKTASYYSVFSLTLYHYFYLSIYYILSILYRFIKTGRKPLIYNLFTHLFHKTSQQPFLPLKVTVLQLVIVTELLSFLTYYNQCWRSDPFFSLGPGSWLRLPLKKLRVFINFLYRLLLRLPLKRPGSQLPAFLKVGRNHV